MRGSRGALYKEHVVRAGCMRVLGFGSVERLSGADRERESDPRLRSLTCGYGAFRP